MLREEKEKKGIEMKKSHLEFCNTLIKYMTEKWYKEYDFTFLKMLVMI